MGHVTSLREQSLTLCEKFQPKNVIIRASFWLWQKRCICDNSSNIHEIRFIKVSNVPDYSILYSKQNLCRLIMNELSNYENIFIKKLIVYYVKKKQKIII